MDEQSVYLITWVTHNSRISERMVKFGVKKGNSVRLDIKSEIIITKIIRSIVIEYNLQLFAHNICCDHVHLILVCREEERDRIISRIKGKSSFMFHKGGVNRL